MADALSIEPRTLYNWAKQLNWTQPARPAGVATAIEVRIGYLLEKPEKSLLELLELERLLDHHRTLTLDAARRNMPEKSGRAEARRPAAIDEESRTDAERPKRGRKPGSNDLSWVEDDAVVEKLKEGLFGYQLKLWELRRERTRNILKSRQIGLTFYFAREAFADALLTGRNKIFISASRAQAEIFKDYIKEFARDWFELGLKGGSQIVLHTPHGTATLYFLSTNSATGQGRHGDVYLDEYFWMPNFQKAKKLISASASQKKWGRTFFSTPSTTTHEAYPYWTGDEFNERNRRANKKLADFPDFETLRKAPVLCPDGQMRWIIILDDAEAMGCTLFDRAQLELEYSPEEFKQLFGCRFIDDKESVFKFSELKDCLGDAAGFPKPARVWIGYDPSRVRDGACIAVVAPPESYKGNFYVIEKITLKNASWSEQARTIRELTEKYTVEFIGIDATGPGSGVLEMVRMFFPRAIGIVYTTEVKTKLVLKAQSVIGDRRIKWDAGYSDIAAGFLQIKKSVAGNAIIYYADRSEKTGHADAAWAIMHALSNEDLILTERGSTWSL